MPQGAGWRTRKETRQTPVPTAEQLLQGMLNRSDARMQRLNDMYLRMMGEHIRDIGTLWPSDVHRLQQIRRMNKNLIDLEAEIAKAANLTIADVHKTFRQIAQTDYRMGARIMGQPTPSRVSDNEYLQRIIQAQAKETEWRMRNLSNTTVTSSAYRAAVDEGVNAVINGEEDYGSAIRRSLKNAGSMGLRLRPDGTRAVDYASGHSRRLDSAVRMNILDGARHINQDVRNLVGQEFGADGVEIDAHALCAEDHLPYQGLQYSNADFELIQDSLQRPFGEWNCRHTWAPILLGISAPRYTQQELDEMRQYSTEQITIDGKTHSRYEWSQVQRRMETAIRQQKDTATLARYAGDDVLQRQCQERIRALNDQYDKVSAAAGLEPEYARTDVFGFRDYKESTFTNNVNSDIIEARQARVYDADNNAVFRYPKSDVIQNMTSFDEINEYFSTTDWFGRKSYLFSGSFQEIPIEHQKAIAEAVLFMRETFGLERGHWPSTIRVQKTVTYLGKKVAGYYEPGKKKIAISTNANKTEGELYLTSFHELIHHYDKTDQEAKACVRQAISELSKTIDPETKEPYSTFAINDMKYAIAKDYSEDEAELLAYSMEQWLNTSLKPNPLAETISRIFCERNARS